MCRRGTIRAPERAATRDVQAPRDGHRVQIDREVGPGSPIDQPPAASATCAATRHARHPDRHRVAEEDLRKGLAHDRADPRRGMACGACSRDEPQPKFAFTSSTVAPAVPRVGVGWIARGRPGCVVFEEVLLEAFKVMDCRNRAGMIRSVSMLLPRSGSARPAIARDASRCAISSNAPRRRPLRRRPRPRPPSPGSSAASGRWGSPGAP